MQADGAALAAVLGAALAVTPLVGAGDAAAVLVGGVGVASGADGAAGSSVRLQAQPKNSEVAAKSKAAR